MLAIYFCQYTTQRLLHTHTQYIFNRFYYFKGFPFALAFLLTLRCHFFVECGVCVNVIYFRRTISSTKNFMFIIICIMYIFRMRIVHFQLIWYDYLPFQKKAKSVLNNINVYRIKSGIDSHENCLCLRLHVFLPRDFAYWE